MVRRMTCISFLLLQGDEVPAHDADHSPQHDLVATEVDEHMEEVVEPLMSEIEQSGAEDVTVLLTSETEKPIAPSLFEFLDDDETVKGELITDKGKAYLEQQQVQLD